MITPRRSPGPEDAFGSELNAGQQSALISWLAFTGTFGGARGITHAIRAGLALIVDEFALLLDLKDVYWAKQGRVSVDTGIGLSSTAASYFAALPVLRKVRHTRRARKGK